MDLSESGLQEVANAMRGETGESHSQKRKREAESADDRRSGNKRISPGNKAGDHLDESLQDYSHHGLQDQNGTAEHASTAAAALAAGGAYPTMTIPQATDVSFATQASDSDRNDQSFMGEDMSDFMSNPQPGPSRAKPAVGSDEWHKVRKDNHKEGKFLDHHYAEHELIFLQSKDGAARPLMRVSTSWPRLSQDAKRTRALFFNVRFLLSLN
jgi:hypothetical protein